MNNNYKVIMFFLLNTILSIYMGFFIISLETIDKYMPNNQTLCDVIYFLLFVSMYFIPLIIIFEQFLYLAKKNVLKAQHFGEYSIALSTIMLLYLTYSKNIEEGTFNLLLLIVVLSVFFLILLMIVKFIGYITDFKVSKVNLSLTWFFFILIFLIFMTVIFHFQIKNKGIMIICIYPFMNLLLATAPIRPRLGARSSWDEIDNF